MKKNLTDNYEKQIYIGRDLFLKYDQDMLIKKYKLKNDHTHLYLNYIGTEYRVSRSDGSIEYMAEGIWKLCKEYTIVMTIYDLLCYSEDKTLPPLTGQWQPVTRFIPTGSSPSGDVFTPKYEAAFSGKVNAVSQACLCLGDFSVVFQFWDADEEFSAKILLLWDKVSLSYLHFETTFYLQGDLLEAILQKINA